ncbi:phytoene desaturase, partial [Acinetobacter baumannii]
NKGLVRLFEDLGGTLVLSTSVRQIETTNGHVRAVSTDDGRRFPADIVASNADVVHTYRDLLSHEPRAEANTRSLLRKRFSMSLFVI